MEAEQLKGWLQVLTQGGALGILFILIYKAPQWINLLKEGRIELAKTVNDNHSQVRHEFMTVLEKNEVRCFDQQKETAKVLTILSDNVRENTAVAKQLSERLK